MATVVKSRKRRALSRAETLVMMYAGAAASLLVVIVSMKAGGLWWLLAPPASFTAGYATVRGSELLHARANE